MASPVAHRLFIFGLGYVGVHVGCRARDSGWHVSGASRTAEKAARLRGAFGIETHTFDIDDDYTGLSSSGLEALRKATHVLATVPPVADFDKDPLLALHAADLLHTSQSASLRWAGYLSTTSVYGDHGGAWVDEISKTVPEGSRAFSRLCAERDWLQLRDDSNGALSSHVFRSAGIYGPGRSAVEKLQRAHAHAQFLAALQPPSPLLDPPPNLEFAGPPGVEPREVMPKYTSRMHVADICSALLASMASPASERTSATYNLADDEPATRTEVEAYVLQMMGKSADVTAVGAAAQQGNARGSLHFGFENKRVSNRKLLDELMPQGLAFPSYREGLKHIFESQAADQGQGPRLPGQEKHRGK
ncbi:unnamed protein product [Polarella glacialis]|uniref:NAD-dependent epimerase/dehydratase domain-containing protein n=1 Tax=Polarella glacialis TaxID=89957 RepID=A0A813FPT3_POLGL|nr:unnamed protein product [Polarella glacialis]